MAEVSAGASDVTWRCGQLRGEPDDAGGEGPAANAATLILNRASRQQAVESGVASVSIGVASVSQLSRCLGSGSGWLQ
jgi:hypothetical protein